MTSIAACLAASATGRPSSLAFSVACWATRCSWRLAGSNEEMSHPAPNAITPAASGLPWVCCRTACGASCTAAAADEAVSEIVDAADDAMSDTFAETVCVVSATAWRGVPADQRVVHADMPHGDAVGHRDRAERHREPARPVHALLRRDPEPLQRQVARVGTPQQPQRRRGRGVAFVVACGCGLARAFPRGAETVAVLLAAEADVNARFRGPHQETPLHWAASSNDVAVLDALLDSGADIEARGAVIAGGTALSDATAFAQWDAARRLVERGADANLFEAAAVGLLDRVAHGRVRRPTWRWPGHGPRCIANGVCVT